jgi:hypothetical protein
MDKQDELIEDICESTDEAAMKKVDTKSLFICGRCGKDTSNLRREVQTRKITHSGYANVLCWPCRCQFEDALKDVAKSYLKSFSQ